MINFVYEGSTLLPWKLEVSRRSELEMTKPDTGNETSGLIWGNLWTYWRHLTEKLIKGNYNDLEKLVKCDFETTTKKSSRTIMADQPSSSVNPAPHSRGGRHRSRKQQKPSTAEREQKKASRLQALGPGESIKEKQVSNDCKRAKTFMTSWGLACHATRSWRSWCCRNVFFLLAYFENPVVVSWDLSW